MAMFSFPIHLFPWDIYSTVVEEPFSLFLSIHPFHSELKQPQKIYIYTCVYIYIYIYMCIYTYIYIILSLLASHFGFLFSWKTQPKPWSFPGNIPWAFLAGEGSCQSKMPRWRLERGRQSQGGLPWPEPGPVLAALEQLGGAWGGNQAFSTPKGCDSVQGGYFAN